MIARLLSGGAALGAGVIHLATAIGSPPAVAAVVAVIGLAEFAWGAVAIALARIPLPGVARIGAVVPVVLWVLLLVVAGPAQLGPFTSSLRLAPMLVASALDLVVVVAITAGRRRAEAGRATIRGPGAVATVVVSLAVVAVVTSAALTATEAGEQARTGTGFFASHDH